MIRRSLFCALVLLFVPALAHASSSGYLKGKLAFYDFNGGYCPTTSNCTGARYVESQYKALRPVRDAIVYLRVPATGAPLGQAVTDASGNFTIHWNTSTTAATFQAQVYWTGMQKDGVFSVTQPDGSEWLFTSSTFTLTTGSTAAAPQNRGEIDYGTPSSANRQISLYQAMWTGWTYAFAPSSRLVAAGMHVQARAFDSGCSNGSACTNEAAHSIDMGNASALNVWIPIHEMGHAAAYFAKPHDATDGKGYCYPEAACGSNDPLAIHGAITAEWYSTVFEEGFADFVGDMGLYAANAVDPRDCNVGGLSCAESVFSVEDIGALCNTTNGTSARNEVNFERFLWDLYDTHDDGSFVDNRAYAPGMFYDTWALFTSGTGFHAIDEQNALTPRDYDRRGPKDYVYWLNDVRSVVFVDMVGNPALTPATTLAHADCQL